jgi:hypothetical protein
MLFHEHPCKRCSAVRKATCIPACTLLVQGSAAQSSGLTLRTSLLVLSDVRHSLVHRYRNIAEPQVQPARVLLGAGDNYHAVWWMRYAVKCKRPRPGSTASCTMVVCRHANEHSHTTTPVPQAYAHAEPGRQCGRVLDHMRDCSISLFAMFDPLQHDQRHIHYAMRAHLAMSHRTAVCTRRELLTLQSERLYEPFREPHAGHAGACSLWRHIIQRASPI